ncbi:hypothetical protein CSUI_009158 [Cystoisospora suis]|uniref:Transmembrane protein n=1 Tax=Cystoisospora suis TaxID=483139 RepID=A0A2C6KKV5_9APIC|nr:hypothetical protein CSUI_009158 [Cystoisospora suis]
MTKGEEICVVFQVCIHSKRCNRRKVFGVFLFPLNHSCCWDFAVHFSLVVTRRTLLSFWLAWLSFGLFRASLVRRGFFLMKRFLWFFFMFLLLPSCCLPLAEKGSRKRERKGFCRDRRKRPWTKRFSAVYGHSERKAWR